MNELPKPISASVTVAAPARLHLGFLDLNGNLGRRFGSIGLAIDGFKTRVTAKAASANRVEGPNAGRAEGHLAAMQHVLGVDVGVNLTIDEVIPAHAGLGSGTQLALAVAVALRRLCGLPLDLREDAARLGRGHRSGIGIGLFRMGGLVVDGGRRPNGGPAPIISRIALPEQWRVLVVRDPRRQGVHGTDETKAFVKLPPFPAEQAGHLCRLVLMQALPAAADGDLVNFGAAIKDLQHQVGQYFAPLQGGKRFTSAAVEATLLTMEQNGAHGVGQSSWGPTGFAFVPSVEDAERIVALVCEHANARDLDIRICRALNRGADVTMAE